MTALADQLARHISHRLTTADGTRLRCWDCTQTIDLRPVLGATTSPARSTSSTSNDPHPARIDDPNRCPHHLGQLAHNCGPCRAEQLARPDDAPARQHQPTADVAAGAAAARAALTRQEHRA